MHFIPHYAPQIGDLATKFQDMPIILDHLARPGQGTVAEYNEVVRLAELPRVYMKFSQAGVQSSSKQGYPYLDAKPIVKRVYEAFGADRIIAGGLGGSRESFEKFVELLEIMFDFTPEADRAKIRGLNAKKLFAFQG